MGMESGHLEHCTYLDLHGFSKLLSLSFPKIDIEL